MSRSLARPSAPGAPTQGAGVTGWSVRRTSRVVVRLLVAAVFAVAGVQHLACPTFFYPQYPTFLPAADLAIRGFGVAFLVCAAGLLAHRALRRRAALGLIVLLVLVWPGNWWGALQPGSYVSPGASNIVDWIRVPFQLVWIAAVAWSNLDVLRPRRPRTAAS